MPLPNFLVIGAARSGTTSLHHYLQQHPEVFMSAVKEPNYFSLAGDPLQLSGPGALWLRDTSTTKREAYEALFAGVTAEKAIGEASPRYLTTPDTAERIQAAIPHARLVAILRHPAERAHAAYVAFRRDGFDPAPTFEAALDSSARGERDSWAFMQYTRTGYYHRNLVRYARLFSRPQLRVYLYDDLVLDGAALMRDLFDFIGVDPAFRPDLSSRLGGTGAIRNPILGMLWRNSLRLRDTLRPFLARRWRDRVYNRVTRDLDRPPLSDATRGRLLQLYRDDTLRLQEFLGRDLSRWLR